MRIKKIIKIIGRVFITLKQENERIIGQSVLIVDNGYSWLGHLVSGIERIKKGFPRAKISVLTFEQRKSDLQKDFSGLNYIHPSQRLKPKRYQIALQMLMMREKKFDLIVLSSLDISSLIAALLFLKSKVVLYNQWGQWWFLRLRNINEIFKVAYVKKKVKFNFKSLPRRIGLSFVLLQRKDEKVLKHSILIVDNGYVLFEQIKCAIQRIKESLPEAKISVLALEQREELKDNFPNLEIITPNKYIIKAFPIIRDMLRLRRNRYDYIILLSLEIMPIFASIFFMNSKVILYNQWHQWWLLKPKSMKRFLTTIPQFIFNVIVFIYLLISVSWIFLKRSFNLFRFSLLRKSL
ncbi:MAG: hypothetical protein ISS47_01290 [Candidatus Omnitrophica bacterium]|nr:hypothetical protein [Candidatus Omnitrophota bacterium]